MSEKTTKIEIVEDLSGKNNLIFYVDAGAIDDSEVEELLEDIKMIIQLRKKG